MYMEGFYILCCAFFVVTFLGFVDTAKAACIAQEYANAPPTPYDHDTFIEIVPFNKKSVTIQVVFTIYQ